MGMKDSLGDTPYATLYPHTPGFKTTGTSEGAATSMRPSADDLRAKALAHIKSRPSTADETAEALGETVLAVRPRVAELRATGAIRPARNGDKELRRANRSGRSATVWESC